MVDRKEAKILLVVGLMIASLLPAQALLGGGISPMYDSTTDLVARRTSSPPTIDGIVDAVWDTALPLATFATGNSGNFDIYLRSMFDDDYIYLLATWNEFKNETITPVPDVDRGAWELVSNTTPGTWDHKLWGEDRLSFLFEQPDMPVTNFSVIGCDAICHDNNLDMFTNNPGEKLDAWVWSAATTNLQGYADDGVLLSNNSVVVDPTRMHTTIADLDWDDGEDGWWVNNDTSVGGVRPTHVWKPGATPADPSFMVESDAQEVDWGTFDITTLATGTMVPGHVLRTPNGDRADVQAKGVHNGTGWTVEFKRLRDTGSPDDVIFDRTNVGYNFSPSITDNRTGVDHSKGIKPYMLWLAEPDLPDLTINRVSPLGTYFQVNSTVTVGVYVGNIGWADATPCKLQYQWQGQATQWTEDVVAVPWGKTHYVEFDVDTSGLDPGEHGLMVTVDVDGDVTEINETNNDLIYPMVLVAEPLPDLEIVSMSLQPESPTTGGFSQIRVKVRNNGTASSSVFKVLVYLEDPGSPVDQGDMGPLDPATEDTFISTWGPITLPEGDYVLNATVDSDDEVREFDETDNQGELPFTLSAPSLPDLVVASLTPLSGTVTQGAETSAQVVVENLGGMTVTSSFEVALFLDEPFTVGTMGLVSSFLVTDDIPSGSSTTVVLDWTVPEEANVGNDHFLRAEVDWMKAVEELDEENNNRTYDGLMVLRRPLPDLTVDSVAPASPTAKLETLLSLTVTVKNSGTLSSSNTTLVAVDTTHNRTLPSLSVPALVVNASVDLVFEWLVTGVPVGNMEIQFMVDAGDFIREESEFNNARSVTVLVQPADLPDLRVAEDGITFTPAIPRVGDAVTISVKVENVGTAASSNTTMDVYVGNNRIDSRDLLVLGVGENRVLDVVWPASNIVSATDYLIIVRLDQGSNVKELNETNNEMEKTITFVIPPTPVLENLGFSVDKAQVKTGGEVTFTVTIENTGDAPDLISIVIKDGTADLASKQGLTVAAGGNRTETISVALKGTGDHSITVTIYRGGEIAKDATGNDLVTSLTVKVKKKEDGSPGYGMAIAIVALLGAMLAAGATRRRR